MSELKIIKRAIPYNRSTKHSILNEGTNLYRRESGGWEQEREGGGAVRWQEADGVRVAGRGGGK